MLWNLPPTRTSGYRGLGKAYLTLGQKEQALQAYQKAIDINPYYWFNYNSLGQAYSQLGEYDKALIALRRVIELEPENSFGYLNVGVILLSAGKIRESVSPTSRSRFRSSHTIRPTQTSAPHIST